MIFLPVALVLSGLVFWRGKHAGLNTGLVVALAVVPLVATFFMGLIGLLGSALFVGALFKTGG